MESLASRLIQVLRAGTVDDAAIEAGAAEDPAAFAEALTDASKDEDLCKTAEVWLPGLIESAQPAFGLRTLVRLVDERRELGRPIDLNTTPALAPLLGSSRFLARRLLAHPEWIDALAGTPPDAPSGDAIAPTWEAIRRAKYRGLMRIAARDLMERSFEASLRELSDLADRCLVAALACAADECGTRPPALLALGKLGGRELNFSSDVDLLFVYELEDGEDPIERSAEVAHLIRHLKTQLEAPSTEGFGYRVDLDLRPEGRSGVLANPVDAALTYYESFGAEWERQMLIRLRKVAGSEPAAERFARSIAPFVYRRLIGPDVMREVHDMKGRIETERRVLPSASARGRGLGELGMLPPASVESLHDAYLWLRRAEHALQLAEEQQTDRVPRAPAAQTELARRMGYRSGSGHEVRNAFLEDWTRVRAEVRGHFDALVLGDPVQ